MEEVSVIDGESFFTWALLIFVALPFWLAMEVGTYQHKHKGGKT